jgi:dihydroflavonol-4-reductase
VSRVKRVLVTGATGFVGRHLVAQIAAAEPETRLRLLCRRGGVWDRDPSVEVFRGDLTEPASLDQALDGVEQVYHLAGRVSHDPGDRWTLYRTNLEGTRKLCAAAARHGAPRIVHVSTSGATAVSRRPRVHDERSGYQHELVGAWPYYLSKLFAEKVCLTYARRGELPIVVASPSLILGPGGGPTSTNSLVALFLKGRIPAVPRGGLNFVDVRDAAAGLILAMRAGRPGERYLLGGPNWTFGEFLGHLARLSGRPLPRLSASPPLPLMRAGVWVLQTTLPLLGRRSEIDDVGLAMSALFWYVDSSKARSELGFRPREPDQTLRDTIEDLRRPGQAGSRSESA